MTHSCHVYFVTIHTRSSYEDRQIDWTALFYNGRYIINEILSEKKFITIYESLKGK